MVKTNDSYLLTKPDYAAYQARVNVINEKIENKTGAGNTAPERGTNGKQSDLRKYI